jgi:hypothetical protein
MDTPQNLVNLMRKTNLKNTRNKSLASVKRSRALSTKDRKLQWNANEDRERMLFRTIVYVYAID